MQEQFERQGYAIVPGLLSAAQRRAILSHDRTHPAPETPWAKARAARDPFYAALGTGTRMLSLLRPLLGGDILLWGVDILRRAPGAVHPWHCDIESCAPGGGFVSVWIGLENTNRKSALNLVPGSHLYGATLQEQAFLQGVARGNATDADIRDWARGFDPGAEITVPAIGNGDALFFDGRLWHGSRNSRRFRGRSAILMQYARADRPVRMFDPARLEWPLRLREDVLPPVLLASGTAAEGLNRIVPAP